MSRIRANTIVNGAGTGAPNFPRGAIISGISTITADITTGSINIGTGTSISSPATNTLTLGTNNTEKLRITSGGNFGIGTNNPERLLSLSGSNAMIQIEGSGGNGKQWSIISSDDVTGAAAAAAPGNFVIYDDTSGGLGDVLTLTGVGGSMGLGTQEPGAKLHVAAGNIKVDNGYGIDFSATSDGSGTMTSELLDDYEEGTWTPINGEGTGTFSNTSWGHYTKIGARVWLSCLVIISTMDNSTSTFTVAGVPYTPMDPGSGGFTGSVMANNITFASTTHTSVVNYITDGTNGIRLYGIKNNAGWDGVDNVDVNANDSIYMSISYLT